MKIDWEKMIFTKSRNAEAWCVGAISAFFFLFFCPIFFGKLMLSHDSIRWYGVYHFFADALSNGVFPYWNPFDYSGQPFYYNLGILRLYEPITVVPILINKFLKFSLLSLYHWEYMARVWLIAFGAYLCYRQVNKYSMSNIAVFGIFLFSSFTMTCLRQNGVLYVLAWAPWAMYFLLRSLKNFTLYNAIGFSFFMGLSMTSYQGVYALTCFFVFLATLLINDRERIFGILKNHKRIVYILLGVVAFVALSAPLLALFIEQGKVVPIARLDYQGAVVKSGVSLTQGSIDKAATHSSPLDFIELIFPAAGARGFFWGWFGDSQWLRLSECFLYIGILPFLLCIAGAFLSKDRYRINFIVTLIVIGLLTLGPKGIVFNILYLIFYPLRFARHMHLFSGYFLFILLYFVGQGADVAIDKLMSKPARR